MASTGFREWSYRSGFCGLLRRDKTLRYPRFRTELTLFCPRFCTFFSGIYPRFGTKNHFCEKFVGYYSTKLRSLHLFMDEAPHHIAVRVWSQPYTACNDYKNIPTIAADNKATKAAPSRARKPYSDRMGLMLGAIPPTPPIRMPMEAKLAKPQST